MKKILDEEILKRLRSNNIITVNEIAYKHGDLYIAEDAITGNKRTIEASHFVNENISNKRILRG